MKAKTLVLVALVVQAIFFVFFVFSAPEPHGFLKGAIADLDEPPLAAVLANNSELKNMLTTELMGALKTHAFLARATLIVTVVTMITLFLALLLSPRRQPNAASVARQQGPPE